MPSRVRRADRAALWALVAAATACSSSDDGPGYAEGEAAYERGDFERAHRIWKPLADEGHADAQVRVGAMYFHGEGVDKDADLAVGYWTEAAAEGDLEAKIGLGNAYAEGRGASEDQATAVRWWRLAAKGGHVDAQVGLAQAYANARGVDRDFQQAEAWWRRATDQGSLEAKLALGNLYLTHPDEVEGDGRAGVELIRGAAEAGHVDAQYGLGLLYQVGRGVDPDPERARELLERAAAQGHAGAQSRLAEPSPGGPDPEPPHPR